MRFQSSLNRPGVSVILTSYNYAEFVGAAIDSVFSQTYRPLELIVVDDGSTDRSVEIIRTRAEQSPIPIQTFIQENSGQAHAWNKAFNAATGEVIAFLDSDDTWEPGKVEEMIRLMALCPGGGLYQHQLENEAGEKKQRYLNSGDFFSDWKGMGRINLAIHQGRISPCVPSSGLMFRKDVLDKVFPVPEQLRTCPDAFLTRTVPAFGPIYSHPATLGHWREHGKNAGLRSDYSYNEFWLPIIMPALNQWYRENNYPIELYYKKRGLLKEGLRHLSMDSGGFWHYFKGWLRKKVSLLSAGKVL